MRPIVITAAQHVLASPEEVWRFVSDTDRTNRVLGAKPVEYVPIEDEAPTSARFLGRTSAGGLPLTYEEMPFEWSHARALRVERQMRGGALASYVLEWTLTPKDQGTDVRILLTLSARYGVVAPVVWLEGRAIVAKLRNLVSSIDAHVREQAPSPFTLPPPAVNEGALAQGLERLGRSGVGEALRRKIARHVREAGDADLIRIRPFELADGLKENRHDVLVAMLHGVPAGLFDLRWAIVCPSCNTASELATSLEEVKPEGHCQLCDISFELDLDRAVEATFVPHESVRRVENQMFCIGGPARTPHVWSQTNVPPANERSLAAPRDAGRYRVFARGGAVASVEVEAGAPPSVRLAVTDGGVRPAETNVAPGGTILVTNETSRARHVKLERLGYANDAATAHYLSTVEDFRRLFSRELLKRGTSLKVARAAILFSDLTGSTALYTKIGDAAAFRLVDDHFDVIRAAVAARGGVIVKTMGDAVMAAFREPHECVLAAADALRAFESFRASHEHGASIGLKLGAYAGPCYVVSANGALDYFGQTVNVASRVQHLAESGEIVIPLELFEEMKEQARGVLCEHQRFEARVKGVETPLALVRAVLDTTARTARASD